MKKIILPFLILTSIFIGAQGQIVRTVGSGADYPTLKDAFDVINAGTIAGDISLQIIDNLYEYSNAELYETGSGSGSDYTSVTIYPIVAGLSIICDIGIFEGPLVYLNGADYVTIDGRLHGTDGSIVNNIPDLTISNRNSGILASTILFINDAENNDIKYCNIKGSDSNLIGGIIFFSSANSIGNNGNTIENNYITADPAGRPVNVIYSNGTTGSENSGNTISNNNIFNFLNPGAASNGIFISSNSTSFTISGNSFFETGSFAPTSTAAYSAIRINNTAGSGFNITGNYIGGSASLCGGGPWTKTNSNNNIFTAIYVNAGAGSTSNIQNNTIQNFSWRNTSSAAWTAIQTAGGTVEIGTITGNTIGAATGTSSITTGGSTGTNVYGINITGSGIVDCRKNIIGSISIPTGSSAQNLYGLANSGTGSATINGNTICNLINNTTNTSGVVAGIYSNGSTGTNSISDNFIFGLGTDMTSTTPSVYGIRINKGNTNYANNIISLGGNTPTAIYGIYETGTAGNNNNLYFNTIYISGSPTTGSTKSYALYSAVTTNLRNIRNNIFKNSRSTEGGSDLHYAAWFNYSISTGLTLNYNDYYVSGSGGTLGYYNGSNITSLPLIAGMDVSSSSLNPVFTNPGGVSASDFLPLEFSLVAITGTGILTDYSGITRSLIYPAMGAIEYSVSPCANPTSGGTVTGTQTDCGPFDPDPFTSTVPPAGYSGVVEYKWQSSVTGSSSGFSGIPGANSDIYDPPTLSKTTWFRRLAKVTCKSDWTGAAESNVIEITVNDLPDTELAVGGSGTICSGTSTIITVDLSVSGINYQLRNALGNINVGSPVSGTGGTINLPTGNLTSTTTFNVLAINTSTNCEAVLTELEVITVDPVSNGGTLTGGTIPVTYGETTGDFTLSGQTGTIVKWQKMLGSGSWEDITNVTNTYSEVPPASGSWQYRVEVKSGVCPSDLSDPVSISVQQKALTVRADNQTKTFGSGFIFSGTEFTSTGLINGDIITSVTLSSQGSDPLATVSGSPYNITPSSAVGTGLSNYLITYIDGLFIVTKANQSITFNALASNTFGDADFAPVASASSGLPVSFSSSNNNVALYSNGMIHLIGAGSVVITASQQGNNEYSAAPVVQQTLIVSKASQTITFSDYPAELLVADNYTLLAISSSGLLVLFESSDNDLATIEGDQITGVSRGDVQLRAYSDGNTNYEASEIFVTIYINSTHPNIMYLFTPNGDGFNDYWELPDLEAWGKCDVKVYNRWGMLVFAYADYNNLWDGTSEGSPVPEGAYYFIIKTENEGVVKGTVNVVR